MKLKHTTILEKYGIGNAVEYRIPSITVTSKKTVIVAYESRKETGNDWAEVHITIRRSTDLGKTFGDPYCPHQQLISAGDSLKETFSNPVLITDHERIHLIFHQNYEQAWYCFSDNDGISFSTPSEITGVFRKFDFSWNVCASGPGHGITASNGRLIVPVWLANGRIRFDRESSGRIKNHFPSAAGCIYSDDRGKTWIPGFLTQGIENANETSAAELRNGKILFNFRNERFEKCRVLGIAPVSLDRLETVWTENQLPDPTCFGSMVSKDGMLYFVNCANNDPCRLYSARIHLTVSCSLDEARTWSPILLVDDTGGYADLAVSDNLMFVFYERGEEKVDLLQLKVYERY